MLVVVLGLWGAVVGDPAADLAAGILAYEHLDFRRARLSLDRAIGEGTLSESDHCEALAYLARALAVLDEPRAAQRRFEELLTLRPEHAVSWKETPRIREAFDAASAVRAARASVVPALPSLVMVTPVHAAPPPADQPANPPAVSKPATTPAPRGAARRKARLAKPVELSPPSPSPEDAAIDLPFWWWAGAAAGVLLVGTSVMVWAMAGDGDPSPRPAGTWVLP